MRLGKLRYLLSLLEENSLILPEQREKIFSFIKERQKKQLYRLVRWLFIIGAFWIFFGFLALIQLLNLNFLLHFYRLIKKITQPFFLLMSKVFGPNYKFAICAFIGFVVWGLFFWLGNKVRAKESLSEFKLDYFQESRLRAGTTFFIIAYIAAGLAFSFLNRLLLAEDVSYYSSNQKIIPIFYMLAVPFFLYCAYQLKDQIALLFSIYFIALSLGCFSGYGYACYFLEVSRPVTQLLVGIILVLVGFVHLSQNPIEWKIDFARTYHWTGLLLGFIALWIMSIWGITKPEGHSWVTSTVELWFANILFIGIAISSMVYGAFKEDKLFFNYGLTFFIIETYTIFFDHLWKNLGTAFGSLLLGCLTVATGYLIRRTLIAKRKSFAFESRKR